MREITTKEVQQRLENNEQLNIIDVREVDELRGGRIPSALNIPLGLLEFRTHELDKNTSYIIVCHSGGRSSQATQYLESRGFDVTNMTGGMLSWKGKVE